MTTSEISVPVWTKPGNGMIVRRDALDPEHPQSTYSYIKDELGLDPEDYGYYCTHLTEEQKDLLDTIPDDALFREAKRRENAFIAREMFGDC